MVSSSRRGLTLWVLLVGALMSACSADSPSAPQGGQAPPTPPAPTTTLTVSANPGQLEAGATTPSTITVQATGPVGTGQVTLTTTLGGFGSISGPQSVTLTLNGGGQAQAFLFAGTTPGIATITATLGSQTANTTVIIGEAEAFFISFVQPNTGSPQGGDIVTINGGGFEEPVQVFIGSNPAQIRSVTPSRIQVVVPPLTSGTAPVAVAVQVTINVGQTDQASQSLANGFIYTQGGGVVPPQIFSITPSTGVNEGGTRVTINGDGFESPVQVVFGDDAVNLEAPIESVTRTQVIVRTPAATGFGQPLQNSSVRVRVRNINSGLFADLANGFRYGNQVIITSIGPGEGPFFGGTPVTIHGQGFDSPVAVEYGQHAQLVTSVTGTEIETSSSGITTTSCADVTGPAGVTNIESGNSGTGPSFTYRVAGFKPFITSVTPPSGPQTGNTNVTIAGTNLFDPLGVSVLFGTRAGTVVSANPDGSSLVVRTPPVPNSEMDTEACDANGDGTLGERFIPTSVDVKVTSNSTTCAGTFTLGFTYTPTDATCRNDVGPVDPIDPPVSSFSFTNAGLTVIFTNTSTGGPPLTYLWSFGDTTTSTQQNPVKNYAIAGVYTVSLTVTNPVGSNTSSQFVTVP